MVTASNRSVRRSPLAMAVLLLLGHEPMHPYGLRQRIQDWDKDRVINVTQRNAIYQTIERLERSGLLTLKRTARQENRPDRRIYQATPEGVAIAKQWLLEMVASPAREYPSFPAALAFIQALPAAVVLDAFDAREEALRSSILSLDAEVKSKLDLVPGGVDRIYLLEIEYQRAMWEAELAWVHGVAEDLRHGQLHIDP